MYKAVMLLVCLAIWTCEKPEPQKPNVIFSQSFVDTVRVETMNVDTVDHRNDTIASQPNPVNSETFDDSVYRQYTNAANQKLQVRYTKNPKEVIVRFDEKNITTKLTAIDEESNIYAKESIQWETSKNQKFGKLTINGTWFEFMEAN